MVAHCRSCRDVVVRRGSWWFMVSISAPIYSSSPGSRWQVVDLDFWSIFQVGTVLFCLSLVLEVLVFGILVLDFSLAGFLGFWRWKCWIFEILVLDLGVGFRGGQRCFDGGGGGGDVGSSLFVVVWTTILRLCFAILLLFCLEILVS
ncbi:hypothetical protein P8452_26443 [Trifolium repens]|nr:hypothetical protein P8452_26443 [Trifolium repens]